jgi:single-stranded-DNA-specific exonuclease
MSDANTPPTIPVIWELPPPPDPRAVETIAQSLGISALLAGLLVQRGFIDPVHARAFLKPSLSSLHDPARFGQMSRCVDRVIAAIDANEKIGIWGDYDVDGTTGAALLARFFTTAGVDVRTYIPDRSETATRRS